MVPMRGWQRWSLKRRAPLPCTTAGYGHVVAVLEGEAYSPVFAWGTNGKGECGLAKASPAPAEVEQFRLLPRVRSMVCGRSYTVATLDDNSHVCFGSAPARSQPGPAEGAHDVVRMDLFDECPFRPHDFFDGGVWIPSKRLFSAKQTLAVLCCWRFGSASHGCALAALPRDLVRLLLQWANELPYEPTGGRE